MSAHRISPGTRARAGLTLLELLLVMGILAVVAGAGLGMFATLDFGRAQAAGLVKNVIRSARNAAIGSQSPARVRFEEDGSFRAEMLQIVGTWHFEGDLSGSLALDGRVVEAVFVDDGFVGQGLAFPERAFAEIPVQYDPGFDPTDGFALEVCVRREALGGGRVVRLGSVCALEIGAGGELRGRFVPSTESPGSADERARGFPVVVQSEPGAVPPERWTRVRVEYDRARLTVYVDGVPVAAVDETAPVAPLDGPLILSDERHAFPGTIDRLVVGVVAADDGARLPDAVRFDEDTPERIWFDGGGGLDRTRHREPVAVTLHFEDGSTERVLVGVYGTVE